MKSILAVLTSPKSAQRVLDAAGRMASLLDDVAITALHVRPDVDPTYVASVDIMSEERRVAFERAQDDRTAELRAACEAWSDAAGRRAAWREIVGDLAAAIKTAAVGCLAIVAHPSSCDGDARAAARAALSGATAPVLLVPEAGAASIGRHPVVAWKASRGAANAIECALPILLAADAVTVLIGTEDYTEGDILPQRLAKGFDFRRFDIAGRDIGEALVDEAKAVGGDMLIMGAYTRMPIVEYIFGGATRDVLNEAALPVLLHR